jgi:RNA polymerase sigma factor (sigma-70 family)
MKTRNGSAVGHGKWDFLEGTAGMVECPESTADFGELLHRARQGSDAAAWDLVEAYGPYVLRTIRRTLSREIRGKFDSDDFAQAVWASFFGSPERLEGVTEPRQLVGLLATMARNKVIDEMRRRFQTQRYAVRREQPLAERSDSPHQLKSREPSPSQFAIARERWMRLLQAQPEHYRQVIRLKLMGKTNRSIAQQLGVNEKTVKRVLDRLTEITHDGPAKPE